MDPLEEFHDRAVLFSLSMVAHMARILDRHDLLDEETRALIHATLPGLAESAERCPDDATAELVDLLVAILPPAQR